MELAWIEDFLALSELGSFSRAAEARNLTQPAFSRRIRALEDWVGATLFDRTGQPVKLTDAGHRFRPAADEVIRQLQRGREEARQAEGEGMSTLRFAATHSLSLTFFPAWLRSLEAEAPPLAVRLESDSMSACERLIAHGQSQFLLCHQHGGAPSRLDPRQFRSIQVGEDMLIPVVSPDAAGTAPMRLPGTEAAPLPYLAYSEVSGLGRAVAAMLSGREVWLHGVFVAHLAVLLRTMVREGRGIAWMPATLVADDLKRGTLVPAGDESWNVPLEIRLFRPRSRMSPAAEAFWKLLG
ncbi:LysR family transcriptional regulator [Indioceanicola profundi]|uniref:LysR family transcriptional regulator n=1 Tax=Indioceanicola profundi TaxID=2220096 RepID=UPI000E6AE286|nr:LysR substrate-binding domain-containing protein [Indioceanicola profundi]